MNTTERLLDFASSEKDKKESENPMTALDTLKCGLRWSSDCSGGEVVGCLWSSIVARQQATVTLRAAAKHSPTLTENQPKGGRLQPHLREKDPRLWDSKALHFYQTIYHS